MKKALLAAFAACMIVAPGKADDWPQFRGPDRTGMSGEKGLLKEWPKGGPKIAWTFKAEKNAQPFYASAALGEKLVVVGGRDKRVYAFDRVTGKPAWNFPTRGRIDASPVIAGNRVYVGSLDGTLYVLDLADGKLVQKIELDGPVTGSPAVAEGCLLIGTEKGTLYCLGAKKS